LGSLAKGTGHALGRRFRSRLLRSRFSFSGRFGLGCFFGFRRSFGFR
jgi:hypothetical protein